MALRMELVGGRGCVCMGVQVNLAVTMWTVYLNTGYEIRKNDIARKHSTQIEKYRVSGTCSRVSFDEDAVLTTRVVVRRVVCAWRCRSRRSDPFR